MSASRPPSGRHSPASASGRRSPATSRSPLLTEESLLRLLDLDDCAATDSEDEFSLLNAPSGCGSIGRSTTRSMMDRSAVPSVGTSPVPVSATPVCTGGRNRGEGGVGGLGGVGGGGVCPATRTSTKEARSVIPVIADSSSKTYTPKNADKPQGCIFIAKAECKALRLGKVGSSKRFCLATKELGYSHCGVAAHGRTSKFSPKLEAFYVPGGIVYGHPTAMMDPYILRENVLRHMLSKFEHSSLKAEGWISVIQEAVLYDCVVADEDNRSDGEEEFVLGQSEKEESSTVASEMDEGDKASTFDFQWGETLDELDTEVSPTASAHRTALELLGMFLIWSTKSTAMEFRSRKRILDGIGGETDEVKTQLGNLYDLVQEHGSLADAVQTSLTSGGLVTGDLSDLQIEMDSFSKDIRVFAEPAKLSSETVLGIISRIRDKVNSRHQAMRSRLKMLEVVLEEARRPPSPPSTQRISPANMMYGGAGVLEGDTPLGVASVGGSETVLTSNYLFGLIRDLQAKVDVLTERSKNTGVIFQQVAFSSEAEFSYWYPHLNPSGSGLTDFVDSVSIWTFASGDQIRAIRLTPPNGSMRYIDPRPLVSRGVTLMQCTPTQCLGAILSLSSERTRP